MTTFQSITSIKMLNCKRLTDTVLELLEQNIETNYRIVVLVVGPPGSGKSTIAGQVCQEINSRFQEYVSRKKPEIIIKKDVAGDAASDLCQDIPPMTAELREELDSGSFYSHVEDTNFIPREFIDDKDKSTVIIGRGGLPNSVRVRNSPLGFPASKKNIEIAQVVPMDGFHLSRACLNHFRDPQNAHKRRGSPSTFDSNNYLQLVKILSKSCAMKPPTFQLTGESSDLFGKVCATFSSSLPSIYYPGFDHSLKDPTIDQHCVDGFTRVIIMEGLYLLLNKENWQRIYPTVTKTGAVLIWNIDIDEEFIEVRVAKRHLASGLVETLEEGVKRFRDNDLLNARMIKQNNLDANGIVNIRND